MLGMSCVHLCPHHAYMLVSIVESGAGVDLEVQPSLWVGKMATKLLEGLSGFSCGVFESVFPVVKNFSTGDGKLRFF